MIHHRSIQLLSILTLAGLLACSPEKPVPSTAASSPAAAIAAATVASAPVESPVIPLSGLKDVRFIAVPEKRSDARWLPAEATGDESAQAVLTAPVKGVVSSPPQPAGKPVGKGAALLMLQSPELADLKSRWLQARALLQRAEADLAREQRLADANATSQRDLEAARSEVAVAHAETEAARLSLEARGVSPSSAGSTMAIRAPSSGSVVAWEVQFGQGVEAGQRLGRFQAREAALAVLELPLPGPQWKIGDDATVRSAEGGNWKARVEGLPTTLTADTRRLSYRLRLIVNGGGNAGGSGGRLPLPGQALEVRVPLPAAIYLPQESLQQVEGIWGVFVRTGETADFRPVQRGEEAGDTVLVLSGVKPGETVAASGAYLLKSLFLKIKNKGEE